ncbi:MAG TPA: hypothetical protein VGD53_07195, partial [Actinoallomurus sp.]
MKFRLPNAVPAVDNSVLGVAGDEHSKDLIGDEAINKAVEQTVPAYDDKLDLKLATSALERHSRLGGLGFGKINKDVARLHGLVAAIENISAVIKDGKERLAQDWKGESYDAFRANIENLEKTLNDYAVATRTTADGLQTAMSGIRSGYQDYRNHCVESHFSWGDLSKPGDWWRMSADSGRYLAEHCISAHFSSCRYSAADAIGRIDNKLTNNRLFNGTLEKWDCTDNDDIVSSQFDYAVKSAYDERAEIHTKINAYCAEADSLRTFVGEAYDASLDNLRIIAEANVFSHLSVPGATAGGDPGQGGDSGGYPGGGGDPGGGGGGGGGYPGGGGSPEAVMPPPLPNPAHEPTDAAAAEPADPSTPGPTDPAASEPPTSESIQIKDGDRTISVSSPDGEGHVKVTVDDGTGKPKTYDLDFDAASGLPPRHAEGSPSTDPTAEHVPAGTNGKCVIADGPLRITAERSLFEEGAITITVDNGTGKPTTYTVDFTDPPPAAPTPSPAATDTHRVPLPDAAPGPAADAAPGPSAGAGPAAAPGPAAGADSAHAAAGPSSPTSEERPATAPTPPVGSSWHPAEDPPPADASGTAHPATPSPNPDDPAGSANPPTATQPTETPPANEPPTPEPTTDPPASDTSGGPPTTDPPSDDPATDPPTNDSSSESATEPPASELPSDEAVAEPPAGELPSESAAEPAASELPSGSGTGPPVGELPGDEAVAEPPAGELPGDESATESPAGELPSDEGATEPPAGDLPSDIAAPEPPSGESPADETSAGDLPADDSLAGEPGADPASGELPADEATTEP